MYASPSRCSVPMARVGVDATTRQSTNSRRAWRNSNRLRRFSMSRDSIRTMPGSITCKKTIRLRRPTALSLDLQVVSGFNVAALMIEHGAATGDRRAALRQDCRINDAGRPLRELPRRALARGCPGEANMPPLRLAVLTGLNRTDLAARVGFDAAAR